MIREKQKLVIFGTRFLEHFVSEFYYVSRMADIRYRQMSKVQLDIGGRQVAPPSPRINAQKYSDTNVRLIPWHRTIIFRQEAPSDNNIIRSTL